MLDWAWMADHLDELAARTLQHIEFTVIALLFGFVISFVLAVLAVRRRSSYGPIVAVADILYVIPSLAFFAGPDRDHRPDDRDGRDPADPLHAADLRPQHRRGVRQRAGRRARVGRRHRVHPDGTPAPRRDPAGDPADGRGTATRLRVDHRVGDRVGGAQRRLRRAGLLHPRGLSPELPDRDLLRRDPLDRAGRDRGRALRARAARHHAVVARRRPAGWPEPERRNGHPQPGDRMAHQPRPLAGTQRHPGPTRAAHRHLGGIARDRAADRPPVRCLGRPHRPLFDGGREPRQLRAGASIDRGHRHRAADHQGRSTPMPASRSTRR